MRCRTSYRQALDLCVQEIFLQSNLHCRESSSSTCSLKSCDGKSVASSSSAPFPDVGAVSELVGSYQVKVAAGIRIIERQGIFRDILNIAKRPHTTQSDLSA